MKKQSTKNLDSLTKEIQFLTITDQKNIKGGHIITEDIHIM